MNLWVLYYAYVLCSSHDPVNYNYHHLSAEEFPPAACMHVEYSKIKDILKKPSHFHIIWFLTNLVCKKDGIILVFRKIITWKSKNYFVFKFLRPFSFKNWTKNLRHIFSRYLDSHENSNLSDFYNFKSIQNISRLKE